jgi:hypothetical protein
MMDHKSRSPEEHRSRAAAMLKSGGASDIKQDKALITKAINQHDAQLHGGKKTHLKLATGGPAKKGHGTTNVIIHTGANPAAQQQAAQQGLQQGMRAGAVLGARAAASKLGAGAPGAGPAGGPPPQPAPPIGSAGPGGMPGGGMRPPGMKRGGALSAAATTGRSMDTSTKQREGDWKNTNGLKTGGVAAPNMAGAASGLGRLEKAKSYGASGPVGSSKPVPTVHVPTVKVKAHTRRRGGACE